MPFYARSYKKFPKRTYRSKKRYTSTSKIQNVQKQIRRLAIATKPELKYLDSAVAPHTGVSNVAYIQLLNTLVQGTGDQERVGRQVTNKYLSIRIPFIFTAPSAFISANARIILFIDHQPEASTPSWPDIFQNNTINAFRNLEKEKRFTILKSRTLNFETGSDPTTSTSYYLKWNVRLRCKSLYDSTGNLMSNAIYFAYMADQDDVNIDYNTNTGGIIRLRYTDA